MIYQEWKTQNGLFLMVTGKKDIFQLEIKCQNTKSTELLVIERQLTTNASVFYQSIHYRHLELKTQMHLIFFNEITLYGQIFGSHTNQTNVYEVLEPFCFAIESN